MTRIARPVNLAAALIAALGAVLLVLVPGVVATAAPETPMPRTASLTWTVNGEVQGTPFFGGSNYLSAGVSDGTRATYSATDRDVTILQRSSAGADAVATWDTRAAHLGAGGAAAQLVQLADGVVSVAGGGYAVQWTGAFSVNMYGGLSPYTVADPLLSVAADGTGTLTADLAGYAGTIGSSAAATPVAPASDVVIATFTGADAAVGTARILTPDFAGVRVTTPAGSAAQDTTSPGWGAWPQPFVDFQGTTGLASYFYTSGTASTDPLKPPAPLGLAFDEGTAPSVPVPTATPTASSAPTATPTPIAVPRTSTGRLTWGVKSSFRGYVTGSIAKGSVSLSGGARASDGAYLFTQERGGDYTVARGTGSVRYAGAVRFLGHEGVLDVTLADPVVTVRSTLAADLSVTVGGRSIRFASLDLTGAARAESGGAVSYAGAPAVLTPAGSAIFSYGGTTFYPAGTALDPVTFTIGAPARTHTSTPGTVSAYVAPTPVATSTPLPAVVGCQVGGATLNWGVRESFRSYISGSIAHGAWTEYGGATYATPEFSWHEGTGSVDGDAVEVDFPGGVRFTGHEGALDLRIEKPRLRIVDASHAYLVVDVRSKALDGEPDVVESAVRFASIALDPASTMQTGDSLGIASAPATLTAEGAQAFAGFYGAGEALDPISAVVPLGDCAVSGPAAAPTPTPTPTAAVIAPVAADPQQPRPVIPLLPLLAGIGALLLAAIVALVIVMRRRRVRGAG